jgi:hypothetical protein
MKLLIAGLLTLVLFPPTTTAEAPAAQPSRQVTSLAPPDTALQALGVLASYGYTMHTPAQVDRAVRHWQRANGLTIDGIVGPQTIHSLLTAAEATPAPAHRVDPPAPPPEARSVEQIIRDVWPDNLEDKAVRTAMRESGPNLKVDAANACCYGLFQIYWSVHRRWLAADFGVQKPSDLFDPEVNARAAYALYQQVGWQPWNGGA